MSDDIFFPFSIKFLGQILKTWNHGYPLTCEECEYIKLINTLSLKLCLSRIVLI